MDHSTVWAEIDSILAAIDPNRASWISLLDSSDDPDGRTSAAVLDFLVSLEDWAALNRLEDVVPVMLTHGFDCACFINGVIGEADLKEMGVKCPAVRRHILSAVSDLPRGIESVAASLAPAASVETFMQRLCLQQHLAVDFADLRLGPIDILAGVADSELTEKYRIRKLGHRRRILRCLSRLPPPQPPQPISVVPTGGNLTVSGAISNNDSSNSICSSSGNFSGHSYSTASAAAAPTAATCSRCHSAGSLANAKSPEPSAARTTPGSGSNFEPDIRPGWPHHPQVLLGGSVAYSVSYLGFRPLVDHTDRCEMGQVMQIFRCKSLDILKLPQICLSVCYQGVKFVNPDNEMVITEHRITDIYFACQDNTRRANFAYVTRDGGDCGTHFCHCFASHSQDATILIINTLAEACCLANQLIEFNNKQRLQLSSTITNIAKRRKRRTPHRHHNNGADDEKAAGAFGNKLFAAGTAIGEV